MFLHLIHSARKRLWIATPYFVPDEAVLAALQAASLRGTDVRVLVPARPDQMLVHLAARSYIDDALAAGVRVFRYTEGFMHQKVVLTDRIAAVGTANLDNRSIRINFEITALIEDKAFTDAVGEMLVLDFTRADELPRHWFRRQRWSARLAARAARLLSPIL
jgi:cardiolipin synthase